MERTIHKLLEQLVAETIDRVLETYPARTYSKAFANPRLHKTLMNHVLSQLPGQHTGTEEGQPLSVNSDDLLLSREQQLSLTNLIRQEIVYIIQQNAECIGSSSPNEADSCLAPSHWFG